MIQTVQLHVFRVHGLLGSELSVSTVQCRHVLVCFQLLGQSGNRWAEFTTSRDPSLSAEEVLHRLLQASAVERNTNRAKRAYEAELASAGLDCAWSGEPIRSMHVDHALPWSLWRNRGA